MTKFKKPTSCKIGSLKYKIRYVRATEKGPLLPREAGCIDQHSLRIYIDKEASPQMQLLTLLHEFLHGVAFILYPNKSQDFREHLATAGSELFLQALQSSGLLPTLSGDLSRPLHDKPKDKS